MKTRTMGCLKTLLVVSSMLGAMAALGAGFSGIQNMDSVRIHAEGTVSVIGVDGAWRNPDGCVDSTMVVLSPQHLFYKEIYAAALTAHAVVREVRFRLAGCLDVNGTTYPAIQQVQVY